MDARSVRWYVERRSLELFKKRFVTIGMLAQEIGELSGPLSKRLDLLGIKPIYSAPKVSRIYHRNAIGEVLEDAQPLAKPPTDINLI